MGAGLWYRHAPREEGPRLPLKTHVHRISDTRLDLLLMNVTTYFDLIPL